MSTSEPLIPRPSKRLFPEDTPLQDRISTVAALVYQVLVLAVYVAVPILFLSWASTPFLGILVEHTMVTNGTGPIRPGTWNAYSAGMDQFGYQVLAVDGMPVQTGRELQRVMGTYQVGDTVTLSYLTPADEERTAAIPLQSFPRGDMFAQFYLPYFIGLVYLVCGLWVFRLRRHDVSGRAFTLFSSSVALVLAVLPEMSTTHLLTHLWGLGLALTAGGMFILVLVFPEELRPFRRFPWLRWSPLVVSGLLAANAIRAHFDLAHPRIYLQAWTFEYIFMALAILVFFVWMLVRAYISPSPIAREQARTILLGSLVAFTPLMTWLILISITAGGNQVTPFTPWLLLPLVVFPVAIAYALLRYRLLSTDLVISRGLLYGLMLALTLGAYALLVWAATLVFGSAVSASHPLLIGVLVFLFAVGFNPLRAWLQGAIDATFFRGQVVYQEYLQNFSRELTQSIDLNKMIALLRQYIEQSVAPGSLHIFLYDALNDQYVSAVGPRSQSTTDLRFPANSSVLQAMQTEQTSIFFGAPGIPARFKSDQARLALLGAQLLVAIPGQRRLTGWLALSPKRTGEPYARRDLAFIEALGDQAALAIERAQVVARLERRVQEMNVLARVAQGVNVTLNFDDILELVYAQISQVLRGEHFRVTLYNKVAEFFYHAFYLEDDDRLAEKENQPLPRGMGLEQEVITGQRAVITDDYERECRSRSIIPAMRTLYAWIGVPLNTGAETIGAISLGSRDPAVMYTADQQSLLQAIADQAAGAIVKSQLLQESEQRARQLQLLNQVGRSLTSTLEFEPLLRQILESAVEILGCEAGSLLLVDQDTGELVFEVVLGPVAGDLVGVRLAPGTGLVGKAINTKASVVVNNTQEDKDWFQKPDEQTGFVTRALLVVPMQFRDEPIGVIEVINKVDRMPFTEEDERLLTAFTAQAAVAIQNSRLFTMTDQALAARVEELSVMQRIDRELNAGLEVNRAMQITLDWALRQSNSSVGVALSVEGEGGLRVTAGEGLDMSDPGLLTQLQHYPLVTQAMESGMPQRFMVMEEVESAPEGIPSAGTPSAVRLHPRSESQAIIPIRGEGGAFTGGTATLAILVLESWDTGHYQDEIFDFLVRLADHAAIAISNARLYDEIQAANQAKNDFISFVSHELKNPMTSIRGYTDLILAGAVGPVNEAQTGFLGTIRSNIDRMGSLVSDLADISRIEAGKLRLDFGAVPLKNILNDVVRSSQAQMDAKGQKLLLDVPAELPLAWADKNRLTQVLTNLVSNAHKYTPENGEIRVRAGVEKNTWDPQGAPQVILISVQDNGIGIKPEDQEQIFSKFFRSEDQKAREAPGTGLGLNITKNLVELQGGRIWFESVFRTGTTFSFTIPVAEVV